MADFILSNQDYIFFVYTISFVAVFSVSFLIYKLEPQQRLWKYVSLMSVAFSFSPLSDTIVTLTGDNSFIIIIKMVSVVIAELILFEYSRTETNQRYELNIRKRYYLALIVVSAITGYFLGGLKGMESSIRLIPGIASCAWGAFLLVDGRSVLGNNKGLSVILAAGLFLFGCLQALVNIFDHNAFFKIAAMLVILSIPLVLWSYFIVGYCVLLQRKRKLYFSRGIFLFVILAGGITTVKVGAIKEKSVRESLEVRVKTAAAAIDPVAVGSLTGSIKDLKDPGYKRIKEQLIGMTNENSDVKFMYLSRYNDKGETIFMVDSEMEGSNDYSAPGDVWEDDSGPSFRRAMVDRETTVYGPYSDKWGEWVSAYVPIRDIKTGRTLAVLGVDVSAHNWAYTLASERHVSILIFFVILILLLSFNTLYYATRIAAFALRVSLEKLKESEKYLKQMFSLIQSGVALVDPVTFKIVDINPAGLAIISGKKEDVVGSGCDLICKFNCDSCPIVDENKRVEGKQITIAGTTGKGIPVIKTADLVFIGGKEYILENFVDITELKKVELELKKLSSAVTQSPAIVVITDVNGTIEYVNPKFTSVTGYTAQEAIGQNPRILKTGEMSLADYKDLWETISSGKEWRGVFHNKRKDGSLFWEAASIAPVFNDKGKIVNYLAVKEDVTEKKRIELELAKAQESILNVMRIKDEFLSITSHDLKSPLGIVKTSMGLLLDEENVNDTVKEYAQMSLRQANRGLKLINDLLNLKKLEDGNIRLEPVKFAVSDLIEEVLGDLKVNIDQCGASVEVLKEAEYELTGDYPKLVQVLSNLVDNALKYTGNGGKIRITVSRKDDDIKIGVHDNGPGIPEDKLSVIFEKYEQAGEIIDRKKGHGIGLAIARMICDLHNGKIWVESARGKGASFYFEIPGVSVGEALQEEALYRSDTSQKTILIVDDIPDERAVASKIIKKAGFNVLEASGWKSALDTIRDVKVDAVLLDIEMPEINGLELLEIIRRDKTMEELPVLLFSSRFSEIENYPEYGANDYVNKSPTGRTMLVAKIKHALKID